MSDLIRRILPGQTPAASPQAPEKAPAPSSPAAEDVYMAPVVSARPDAVQRHPPGGVGAVFIDRDGVVNSTAMPVGTPSALDRHLLPGSVEAIARLSRVFPGRVILVTNQSYLSRAPHMRASEEAVQRLLAQRVAENGGRFHAMYYCPNAKDFVPPSGQVGGRKPEPGMLLQAAIDDPSIDLSKSYMIGDQTTDLLAGANADEALTRVLVQSGHAGADGKADVAPDHVARDLSAAVDWIIAKESSGG